MPIKINDSTATVNALINYVGIQNTDSAFIKLKDAMLVKFSATDKINVAKKFIKDNDPVQAKTLKVSTVIFWLLMFALCVLAFVKNYSLIPLLGVATCLYLLTGMSLSNWLWFGGWLAIGLIIYFLYGYNNSKLKGV